MNFTDKLNEALDQDKHDAIKALDQEWQHVLRQELNGLRRKIRKEFEHSINEAILALETGNMEIVLIHLKRIQKACQEL